MKGVTSDHHFSSDNNDEDEHEAVDAFRDELPSSSSSSLRVSNSQLNTRDTKPGIVVYHNIHDDDDNNDSGVGDIQVEHQQKHRSNGRGTISENSSSLLTRRWTWRSLSVAILVSGTIVTGTIIILLLDPNSNINDNNRSHSNSLNPSNTSLKRMTCYESKFRPDVLSNPCSFFNNNDKDVSSIDDDDNNNQYTNNPQQQQQQDVVAIPFQRAPEQFDLIWPTNYYGTFSMNCVRDRAPVQVDRVYNLARHGYYNENYFFRVIPMKYIQFGTNGHPSVANMYNWSSTSTPQCSIIQPQPPNMQRCMSNPSLSLNCSDSVSSNNSSSSSNATVSKAGSIIGLSNTFGTVSMSTSYNETYPYDDYYLYGGVTWNATAELFINIGHDNEHLDHNLFVPICTIGRGNADGGGGSTDGDSSSSSKSNTLTANANATNATNMMIDNDMMNNVILTFPSFGELACDGGTGPDLGLLYEIGNSYIESNPLWNASMAKSRTLSICEYVYD